MAIPYNQLGTFGDPTLQYTGGSPTFNEAMPAQTANWFDSNAPGSNQATDQGPYGGENWKINPDAVAWLKAHPNASIDDMINATFPGQQPGSGGAPTSSAPTGTGGPPNGDFQSWFMQLTQG